MPRTAAAAAVTNTLIKCETGAFSIQEESPPSFVTHLITKAPSRPTHTPPGGKGADVGRPFPLFLTCNRVTANVASERRRSETEVKKKGG